MPGYIKMHERRFIMFQFNATEFTISLYVALFILLFSGIIFYKKKSGGYLRKIAGVILASSFLIPFVVIALIHYCGWQIS